MMDFLTSFISIVTGAIIGGLITGYVLYLLLRDSIFRPKLYFRNIQIVPTKGDIDKESFKWGGLVLTADLCNDSEHWAYNVMIKAISIELSPKSPAVQLNRTPLRLITDLPRVGKLPNTQVGLPMQNIKPGGHISTSVKVITRNEVSINDFKTLIQELRMVQLKARIVYENAGGRRSSTYFWLDFQFARFIHFFQRGLGANFPWADKGDTMPGNIISKNRVLEVESELS
jgi:hypothetical protein